MVADMGATPRRASSSRSRPATTRTNPSRNPSSRGPSYADGPMSLYHLDTHPSLDAPIVVAAFDGWVDGGRAGTLAAEQLAEEGRPIASFDADRIYDYRARRPTLEIVDGKLMSLDWPAL